MDKMSEEDFINEIFFLINEEKKENLINAEMSEKEDIEKPLINEVIEEKIIEENEQESTISLNKRLFVVDTENTNNFSFISKFQVNKNDNIVLFFSNNSKSMTIQTFDEILKCGAEIITQNVKVGGKNALDFQLVAFITEKTIRGSFSEIHVISNDTGFNYAIDYINECYNGKVNLEPVQNVSRTAARVKKITTKKTPDTAKKSNLKNDDKKDLNTENLVSMDKQSFEERALEKPYFTENESAEEVKEKSNIISINNNEENIFEKADDYDYNEKAIEEAARKIVSNLDEKRLQYIYKSMNQCKTYKAFYNSIRNSFKKNGDELYNELIKHKKFNGNAVQIV